MRLTTGFTPESKQEIVLLTDDNTIAYDLDGYSYQWEDGYITWKSDKPKKSMMNKIRKKLMKKVED